MQRCHEWTDKLIDHTRSSMLMQEATINPKPFLYGAATFCFSIWLLLHAIQFLKKPMPSRPATPDLEKPASRNFKAPQRKLGG
jgi:hypothetical protein